MPLTDMYERIVPPKMPTVGAQMTVPLGPMLTVDGIITSVDPEGVVILKLPAGDLLVGYYARSTAPPGVKRITRDGRSVSTPDEVWIFNTIERK